MAQQVLVVDDDRDVRELLQLTLEREGYTVRMVNSGLKLLSTLHVDHPSLIILDVLMKWVDGFELCRAIKKNPQFGTTPVVLISGKRSQKDIDRGMECGALDYFVKPFDLDLLVQRVREIIGPP